MSPLSTLLLTASLCVTRILAAPVAAPAGAALQQKILAPSGMFDQFVRYANYSSASYTQDCKRPPYDSWSDYISVFLTSTQAALYRSDENKELVLAFPGTAGTGDILTDAVGAQLPYIAPGIGVLECVGCLAHAGFLVAWDSIEKDVRRQVDDMLKQVPDYTLTITGHSLGGSLATLAYASLKSLGYPISGAYTFGAMRIGNQALADHVDKLSGASEEVAGEFHRVTHTYDGVPQYPPQYLGFRHPRTEYFIDADPQNAGDTYRCFGQEAPNCNDAIGKGIVNGAHGNYAGVYMGAPESCGVFPNFPGRG